MQMPSHVPKEQANCGGHWLPQAPQLLPSHQMSTQAPPHLAVPSGQSSLSAMHVPPLQIGVDPVQAFPQAPQLALSEKR